MASGSNTFGGTIKLEGEQSYRKAISGINNDLKILASEMKITSAEFKNNDDSIEGLTNKNEKLNEQVDNQVQKMIGLSNALRLAKDKYGENSSEAVKWQAKMNEAKAELETLNGTLNDNQKKLDDANASLVDNRNSYQKLSDTISDQEAKLKVLKSQYSSVVLEQGKNSSSAKDLYKEIKNLNDDLGDNKKRLSEAEGKVDDFGDATKDAGKKTLSLGDIIKANLISEGIISGIKALGGAMVSIAKDMASFVADGIKNASNLAEAQNVVDVTFKDNAETINKWAKDAAGAYGMSELSAKQFNGTMGAMLSSMGLTDGEVLNMSTSMVGLSADMASFYNLDHDEAFNKIRAGISGETEPLKQLGINMSVANLEAFALSQGIETAYKEMTQSEQATLRYNYLMQATADAQGDFARTSDSYANQQKILSLNMENMATAIGGKLIPYLNEGMQTINDMISGNVSFEEGISNLTNMIMDLANKIVEQMPQLLSTGMTMLQTIISGIQEKLPDLITVGITMLQTLLNGLVEAFPQIVLMASTMISTLVTSISGMLPQLLQSGATMLVELINGIVQTLPGLIPVAIDTVLTLIDTLIDNIDMLLDAGITLLMSVADGLIEALPNFVSRVPTIINKLLDAFSRNLPKIISMGVQIIIKLAGGLINAIPTLIGKVPEIITALVKGFGAGFTTIYGIGKGIIEGVWEGIKNTKDWLKNKVKNWASDLVGGIKDFFGIHSPSTLFRDEVGKNLALGVGEGFTKEMSAVSKDIKNAIPMDYDFDVNTSLARTSNNSGVSGLTFNDLLDALKETFKGVNIVLDDEKVGSFVMDKVEGVVYS